MGVSNLTDKRYATHLNTSNSIDSTADRVDEPGRSFWGSLKDWFLNILFLGGLGGAWAV